MIFDQIDLFCDSSYTYIYLFICKFLSHVQFFVTPWTIAHQAPLPMGILQARILEWVAMPFCRGSSQPRGSNPGLPHCRRQILYHLSHQGSPRILEWVAYPFFKGPSQPRNQTRVSCTAGGFFSSWATREAHLSAYWKAYLGRESSDPDGSSSPGRSRMCCAILKSLFPSSPGPKHKQENRQFKLLCYQCQRNKNFFGTPLETPGTGTVQVGGNRDRGIRQRNITAYLRKEDQAKESEPAAPIEWEIMEETEISRRDYKREMRTILK